MISKIDTLKKRYKILKEKKSQFNTKTSKGISWPHYDVCDRLWVVTQKTSGILDGMDAGQSFRFDVVVTTNESTFINPSEASTEVHDMNV